MTSIAAVADILMLIIVLPMIVLNMPGTAISISRLVVVLVGLNFVALISVVLSEKSEQLGWVHGVLFGILIFAWLIEKQFDQWLKLETPHKIVDE